MTILVSMSFAQDYKIEDFLPDSLDTWQVKLQGSLNGGNSRYTYDSYHYDKESDSYLYLMPDIFYNYSKIRRNNIFTINISSSYSCKNRDDERTRNNDGFSYYDKNNNYQYAIGTEVYKYNTYQQSSNQNFNINFDKYMKKDFGLSLYNSSNYSQSSYDRVNKKNNSNDSISVFLKDHYVEKSKYISSVSHIGLMKGRVYNGSYSHKAMEILDELKKRSLLTKELSKAEYLELSEIILKVSTKHHFDGRIKREEALTQIIDYLKKVKAIDNDNTLSTVVVYDTYQYNDFSFSPTQKFGWKLSANIGLEYEKRNSNDDEKETNTQYLAGPLEIENNKWEITGSRVSPFISLGFEYGKIFNYHLFTNLKIDSKYEWNKLEYDITQIIDDKEKISFNEDYRTRSAYLSNNWYYKFDTRSIFNTSISFNYSKIQNPEKSNNYKERIYLTLSPGFTYFINPKLSVNTAIGYTRGGTTQSSTKIIDDLYEIYKYTRSYSPKTIDNYNYRISFNYYL